MTPLSAWAANPIFSGFSVRYDDEADMVAAEVVVYGKHRVVGFGETEVSAVMHLRFELGRLHERLATERGDMFWSFR